MREKTLIIAEAGVNHNGDLGLAKQLVEAAKAAGADLIKFQTFDADALASQAAPKADYQVASDSLHDSQLDMLRKLQLSEENFHALIEYCETLGIGFFSTGFDEWSNALLANTGLSQFKIPSGEITNLPYLRQVGSFGRDVILSTGMASLGEVEDAIKVLETTGLSRDRVTVLHCTTEYPAPMPDVNLRAMVTMGQAFGVKFGYSDHTEGIEVAIAAIGLGATVIEKHLTIDRSLPGPDHAASIEPDEFAAMVRAIRNIELAMGTGIKSPAESEIKNKTAARKSLVAKTHIRKGETFSASNITTKRPGSGLSPMRWDDVVGRPASRDFEENEFIEL